VIIEYATRRLEKILSEERLIVREYGKNARNVMIRMSELSAATSLADIPIVPPPRRHKLSGIYNDCWGVDISKNYRIVIQPVGAFDINELESITSVRIVAIEDYH